MVSKINWQPDNTEVLRLKKYKKNLVQGTDHRFLKASSSLSLQSGDSKENRYPNELSSEFVDETLDITITGSKDQMETKKRRASKNPTRSHETPTKKCDLQIVLRES